jgi:hypothetical protein
MKITPGIPNANALEFFSGKTPAQSEGDAIIKGTRLMFTLFQSG